MWTSKRLPARNGAQINCPASFYDDNYGAKHITVLHCPDDGYLYTFGGDYSGYPRLEDAGKTGDSYRSEIWRYHVPTEKWELVLGPDVPDGQITNWRPDWGVFAWDSKRHRFWFSAGGSCGAFLGEGRIAITSISGLTVKYGGGKLPPNPTLIPNGQWVVPDNATSYTEFDETTRVVSINQTGFTPGSIPLYELVATNGAVKRTDRRPYWMAYGFPTDGVNPRHYADPHHLISFDPVTRKWTDPGLATFKDQLPSLCITMVDGRVLTPIRNVKGMIYDEKTDQLLMCGSNDWLATYSFATNKWAYKLLPGNWMLGQQRPVLVGRKIYGIGVDYAGGKQLIGWSYDIDTRVQTKLGKVPNQVVNCTHTEIPCKQGSPAGPSGEDADLKYDPKRNVILYCEVNGPCQHPYGYSENGMFVAMHAWKITQGKDEWETVERWDTTKSDLERPHGLQWGFDPVNDKFIMWGHNSNWTPPWNDPAGKTPNLYTWTHDASVPPPGDDMADINTVAVKALDCYNETRLARSKAAVTEADVDNVATVVSERDAALAKVQAVRDLAIAKKAAQASADAAAQAAEQADFDGIIAATN